MRQLHLQQGYRIPALENMPHLNQVLGGIKINKAGKRTEGTRQTRLLVTPDVLHRIKTAWEKKTINDDRVMLWAAFTLCFSHLCAPAR